MTNWVENFERRLRVYDLPAFIERCKKRGLIKPPVKPPMNCIEVDFHLTKLRRAGRSQAHNPGAWSGKEP